MLHERLANARYFFRKTTTYSEVPLGEHGQHHQGISTNDAEDEHPKKHGDDIDMGPGIRWLERR